MTFIAPSHPVDAHTIPSFFGRRTAAAKRRLRTADEDGARRALGLDGQPTAAVASGASIEHLARIALG